MKRNSPKVVEIIGDGSNRVEIEDHGYHRQVKSDVENRILMLLADGKQRDRKDFEKEGFSHGDRPNFTCKVLAAKGLVARDTSRKPYRYSITSAGREKVASLTAHSQKSELTQRKSSSKSLSENLAATSTDGTSLIDDLDEIKRRDIEATTKLALVNARIGQGRFRTAVLARWGNCCAVTGSTTRDAVRASHILPWRDSTDEQRLDPNNGLPLIASLDALFDIGLISFDPFGRLLVSSKLTESERKIFGLGKQALLKKPTDKTANYLAGHRQKHGFDE